MFAQACVNACRARVLGGGRGRPAPLPDRGKPLLLPKWAAAAAWHSRPQPAAPRQRRGPVGIDTAGSLTALGRTQRYSRPGARQRHRKGHAFGRAGRLSSDVSSQESLFTMAAFAELDWTRFDVWAAV